MELCAALPEGGTTPSLGQIRTARELPGIGLHVLIRPRGGDFLYDRRELLTMLRDIEAVGDLGADGVVMGCLLPDGNVDKTAMRELMKASEGMSVTFHRAFDMCADPYRALEDITELGCGRILTSGTAPTALQGAAMLRKLIVQAAGRITVMPGGGITEDNIEAIARETGASEFHISARRTYPGPMAFRNERVSMGTPGTDEYVRTEADAQTIRRIRLKLDTI